MSRGCCEPDIILWLKNSNGNFRVPDVLNRPRKRSDRNGGVEIIDTRATYC